MLLVVVVVVIAEVVVLVVMVALVAYIDGSDSHAATVKVVACTGQLDGP